MYRVPESDATAAGEAPLDVKLKASGVIARAERPRLLQGAMMADPASSTGAGVLLLSKLLPASIGAGLMVLVDPPETKRELFVRLFAGLAMSFLLTGATIDGLRSLGWFSWLERGNLEHVVAVAGLWGALGWFVIGGLAMWGKKLRADPAAAIKELRP